MKYISGRFYHPHPVTTTFTNKAAGNIYENPFWIVFTSNYNVYVYVCVCVCVCVENQAFQRLFLHNVIIFRMTYHHSHPIFHNGSKMDIL